MNFDRRRVLALSVATGTFTAADVNAAPQPAVPAPGASLTALGVNAVYLGVIPGAAEDQSLALQRAIDRAAGAGVPLVLPPGVYRASDLKLPAGTRLIGTPGFTRLVSTAGASLVSAAGADHISLTGIALEGSAKSLPEHRGLVHITQGSSIRIEQCDVIGAGGHGIALDRVDGNIADNTVMSAQDAAILSLDGTGVAIVRNTVIGSGNNGILIWRSRPGNDGTLVADNRIEDIAARGGGSGQNGNAINVFRAGNVIIRGNRIARAAFSAVRGNAASNIQIMGNNISQVGEVALYAEFGFEGAVISDNIVDGAAVGIAVTNFDRGGRMAVIQGNLIRNLLGVRPTGTDPEDAAGIGIGVEADSAVTGNVIENAPMAGIYLGWGQYLRDVVVTGNVIRSAAIGIGVSVAPGAGSALIANNLIANTAHGAIVGMEWKRSVTGDLAHDGVGRFAQLTIGANQVR